MNDWNLEQSINIKFCVQLGKNVNEMCALLSEAYGTEDMKKSHVFKLHSQFQED
jgi:hypothetical protein